MTKLCPYCGSTPWSIEAGCKTCGAPMSSYRLVSKNINTAPYTPDSKEVDGWVYQRIDHAIEAVRARRDKLIANKRLAKEWHDKRMAHMDELIEAEESTMDD